MNTKHLANPKEYPDYVVPGWKKIKEGEWECVPFTREQWGKPTRGLTSTLILTDNMADHNEKIMIEFDVTDINLAYVTDYPAIEEKDGLGVVLTHYDRMTQATQKTFFSTCGKKLVVVDQSKVYWSENDPRYQQFYFLPALSLSTAKTCRISNLSVRYNDPANKYWTPIFNHDTYIETPFTTDAETADELRLGTAFYYVTIDFTPSVLADATTYLFTYVDDIGIARYIRIDGEDKHLRHNLYTIDIVEPPLDPDFPVVEPSEHDLGLIEANKDYRIRVKCTHPIAAKITVGMDDKDRHVAGSGFAGILRDCVIERTYLEASSVDKPYHHYLDFQVDLVAYSATNPNTHNILEIASNLFSGVLDTVPTSATPSSLWQEYPNKTHVSRGVISDDIIYIEED